MAYAMTKDSIHDVKLVKNLVIQYFIAKIMSDLKRIGICFWTTYRKNMKQRSGDENLLK